MATVGTLKSNKNGGVCSEDEEDTLQANGGNQPSLPSQVKVTVETPHHDQRRKPDGICAGISTEKDCGAQCLTNTAYRIVGGPLFIRHFIAGRATLSGSERCRPEMMTTLATGC